MRFFVLYAILVIGALKPYVFAQEIDILYEQISEGMPSTEVHDIFQDTLGYMWFATDRGICKYNGNRFQQIETETLFKTKVVYKFFKQHSTKIWVATGKRRIYWFNPYDHKLVFHPHPANEKLETIQLNSTYERYVNQMEFMDGDIILISRLAPGYIRVTKENECKLIESEYFGFRQNFNTSNYVLKKIGSKNYYQIEVATSPTSTVQLNKSKKINLLGEYFVRQNHSFGVSSQLQTTQGEFVGFANYLILHRNGGSKFIELPSIVLCITEFQNSILVGTYNGIYRISYDLKKQEKFLSNYSVTQILEDHTGKCWISTLQSGVLIVHDFKTHQVQFPFFFNTTRIQTFNKKMILFDSSKNKLVVFDEQTNHIGNFENLFVDKYRLKFSNKELIKILGLKQETNYGKKASPNKARLFYFLNEHGSILHYYIFGGKIWKRSNQTLELIYKSKTPNRLKTCTQQDEKTLLIGTDNGLYFFDLLTQKMSKTPIPKTKGVDFNDAIKLKNNFIFATNQGVFTLVDRKFERISKALREEFTGIFQVDSNNFWVHGDKQIFNINITKQKTTVTPFNFNFGDQDLRIVSLALFCNHLWVATKSGVFLADPSFTKPNSANSDFRFVLDSLHVNNKFVTSQSSILAYSEDKISLFFNTICFDHSHSNELQYSIDGTRWYETNKNSLNLSNLPFGDNLLKIRRIDNPGKIIFQMPIFVKKFFYQTTWFQLLIAFLVLLSAIWIFYKILQSQERKRGKKLEKLTLELKLLTSKMNPHFAFNTINSTFYFKK